MCNEWIIDVLSDLRGFAVKQAMPDLAEHLDDAILMAAAQICSQNTDVAGPDDPKNRNISGAIGKNAFS